MASSPWSPYSQQHFSNLNNGSPHSIGLPPSVHDDTLNNYGSATPHPLLMSPCQGLQPMPPRPNTADPSAHPSAMLNSHYDTSIISPPLRSSKEPTTEYFGERVYNGVCKENQSSLHNFVQTSGLTVRNENTGCVTKENTNNGYNSQVPSITYQSIERPSPGPFGVLPHETVMTRSNRYERNKDKFISPISKPSSAPYNSAPYQDHEVSGVYTSTPHSTHSTAFSNDTTSHSPVVNNSVTSPTMSSFSSPSDYYSSPKTNFGAYTSMQSPVPQSPSVAQHSYPSSPFTNVDPNHISAPPCSPMSGGSYMNNLSDRAVMVNQVPQRNGQKSQHSPSNAVGVNGSICYNTQPPGMVHHGHQPSIPKTPDFPSDYNVFPQEHNMSPSSYSVYPNVHTSQLNNRDNPSMPTRSHNQIHMSHDSRMSYAHPSPLPPSTLSSPSYLQSKTATAHDVFGGCSGASTGQTMHPSRYPDCSAVIDSLQSRSIQSSSMMSHQMGSNQQYGYQPADMNDDKNALDMFNSHVDSGVHNPDNCQSSISNFLDTELPLLDSDVLTDKQLDFSEPANHVTPHSAMNIENTNRGLLPNTQMPTHNENRDQPSKNNVNFSYDTQFEAPRVNNFTYNSMPRKRGGRRGRRRKADINSRYYQYHSYKNDRNIIYNNGYTNDHNKFPEYRNNDCYNNYPKSYKDSFNTNDFKPTHYTAPRYIPQNKREPSTIQNTNISLPLSKQFQTVEEELSFLGKLTFPEEEIKESPHTFMKTRNKDSEGFLNCYKHFLEIRKVAPDDNELSPSKDDVEKERKDKKIPKYQPKFIIKMGRCNNPGEWRLTETHVSPERYSDSSGSASLDSTISSRKTQECKSSDNKDRTKFGIIGKLNSMSDILHSSRKRNFEYVGHFDKCKDHGSNFVTNSETLPAGKSKNKSENGGGSSIQMTAGPSSEKIPKKRGRKAKNPALVQTSSRGKKKVSSYRVKDDDPLDYLSHPIKQEKISDDESEAKCLSSRRSSLRSRREDFAVKEEPQPGPSVTIKIEPVDLSSDEVDILDDSDSDPAWTPSARVPKAISLNPVDSTKISADAPVKKQRRRKRRSGLSLTAKRSKEKVATSPVRKRAGKFPVKASVLPLPKKTKMLEADFKVKKEKIEDYFVVSKADLEKEWPPVWRVDPEMNMLQRFDPYEQGGIHYHRNTYTYAAWNDVTESRYVRVKVKTLSCSRMMYIVEYLGLDPQLSPAHHAQVSVSPLRENFEVVLQTLISQALDPNFLSEITNENDEYFLSNIKQIENMTEEKKKRLLKRTWDQELKKSIETYPCVNILPRTNKEDLKCQVCCATKADKLVQFYGPPYDWTTLGPTDNPFGNSKTQFNVCAICSGTVSLYSRLHHQKYNFFIKCRSKMTQVKGDNESMESHVLLEHCLQDTAWVNLLFKELVDTWKECDRRS